MMMNTLFSRASSTSTRLVTLASCNSLRLLLPSSPLALPFKSHIVTNLTYGVLRSNFHASRWVDVRASAVLTQAAGYAVAAEISYDEDTYSPSSSSSSDGLEVSNLGISQDIVTALAKKGITKLFPIQRAVLEPAMQGRDMIGRARTGTGKTLAFGIPIMDKITRNNQKNGKGRNPLAIVLAPTRELARQVEKEFYEAAPNLDTLGVYGGVPIQRQMSKIDHGVDVIVGTPGRVIDLIKRGSLKLSEVRFAVLDEADQMLNVGFADDSSKQGGESTSQDATMSENVGTSESENKNDDLMDDENALLQQALAMSMDDPAATIVTTRDTDMSEAAADDQDLAIALQLSVQEGAKDQGGQADMGKLLADQSFVSSILASLPGVDPNYPSVKYLIASMQNQPEI